MNASLLTALGLSLLAGLATIVGSLIAFAVRRPTSRFLSLALGFSAGVMLSVSFVELFAKAAGNLGLAWAALAFLIGFGAMFAVDVWLPHFHPVEQAPGAEAGLPRFRAERGLLKAGLLTALGIGLHNFPEGAAVFVGTLRAPAVGITLAAAIALHNIPEGIAVSVPVFYATGSRKKAFWWSFLSGLCEPVGALLAAAILLPLLSEAAVSSALAAVAGIMVFITLDELLPLAHHYGQEHESTLGVLAGMAAMLITLILLR